MVRIYTRAGDRGETSLFRGGRVTKDSLRVEAYGAIDELNSTIGLARALIKEKDVETVLDAVQHDLFVVGAEMATSETDTSPGGVPRVQASMVENLEMIIDRYQTELRPLTAFILPGGGEAGALLHFSRTVARRAERRTVALAKAEKINSQLLAYLNRVSDLLFVLARVVNQREGVAEVEWRQ